MKRVIIILSSIFMAGLTLFVISLALSNFNFTSLFNFKSTVKYTENYEVVNSVDVILDVKTSDVRIEEYDNDQIYVEYYQKESSNEFCVTFENDCLEVTQNRKVVGLFGSFTNIFNDDKVIIYIPKDKVSSIKVSITTGDLNISKISSSSLLDVSITTGQANINNVNAGEINVKSTTGDVKLSNINLCSNININGSTSDVEINNTTCEKISIAITTGDIEFRHLSSNDISFKTSTGDVEGRFDDKIVNYTIKSSTSTGKNSLPKSFENGDKQLNVSTSTGEIDIEFSK